MVVWVVTISLAWAALVAVDIGVVAVGGSAEYAERVYLKIIHSTLIAAMKILAEVLEVAG